MREAAAAAAAALINSINPHATKATVGLLLAGTEQGLKWQARAGALSLLGALAKRAPAVSPATGRCGAAACVRFACTWGVRVAPCTRAPLNLCPCLPTAGVCALHGGGGATCVRVHG